MKFTHLKLTHEILTGDPPAQVRHPKFQADEGYEITECPGGYRVAGGKLSAPIRIPFHRIAMALEQRTEAEKAFDIQPPKPETASPTQARSRNQRRKAKTLA